MACRHPQDKIPSVSKPTVMYFRLLGYGRKELILIKTDLFCGGSAVRSGKVSDHRAMFNQEVYKAPSEKEVESLRLRIPPVVPFSFSKSGCKTNAMQEFVYGSATLEKECSASGTTLLRFLCAYRSFGLRCTSDHFHFMLTNVKDSVRMRLERESREGHM